MRVGYAQSVGEACLVIVATGRDYRVGIARGIQFGLIAIWEETVGKSSGR